MFDSGYGGLTVFKEIAGLLPGYDYLYLGDTARAPYGNRSFDTVYQYTLECVKWFFDQGCPLVILACNTASAKALRTIQQRDLPKLAPHKRVLGVIRPSAEVVGSYTNTGHIGILGTSGTINSGSYDIEVHKFAPGVTLHSLACPMWVPLIENGAFNDEGADYFVQKYLDELMGAGPKIDTILLACTHYPILIEKIRNHLPEHIRVISQGSIVAHSLYDYLQRHTEIENSISRTEKLAVYTTDNPEDFDQHASLFFGREVRSLKLHL